MKIKKIYKTILITVLCLFSLSCDKEVEQVVTLYYSDLEGMYLVPLTLNMKLKGDLKNIEKPTEIVPLLMKLETPVKDDLRVCIPKETTFSDIEIDKDKKEISLKIESKNERLGDRDEELMVGAIVNTLTDLNGINSVKINPGNLKTQMDYSESISKDSYRNQWLMPDVSDSKKSLAVVYWFTKNKKYIVPIYVDILKNDVNSLLTTLKKGPQGYSKNYLENTIDNSLDIIIKAVNLNHIDIELKNKKSIKIEAFNTAKQAILLSILELNIFDTVKFIIPDMNEEIVNLKEINLKENLNRVDLALKND